jgi:hypothetical protein
VNNTLVHNTTKLRTEDGTFLFLFWLPRKTQYACGGPFPSLRLKRGFYTPVDSAFAHGGVDAQVRRLLRPGSKRRPCILDYLRPQLVLKEIWATYDSVARACDWNLTLQLPLGGGIAIAGWRSAAYARKYQSQKLLRQLLWFDNRPSVTEFCTAIQNSIAGHGPIAVIDEGAVPDFESCPPYVGKRRAKKEASPFSEFPAFSGI